MNRIFIGFDPRQCVSYTALHTSIMIRSKKPVAITPLVIEQLPLKRTGLTPFTYSRFLPPYLCNYEGWALFLDSDMLLMDDISELFAMADDTKAVHVIKNPKKFEWASVILFNCGHPSNSILTPEYIETADKLHLISWLKDEEIGDLPGEWNHLVGYDTPRHDAKLVHYTQGVPAFPETRGGEYENEWINDVKFAVSAQEWETLMGRSVHCVELNGKKMPRWKAQQLMGAA